MIFGGKRRQKAEREIDFTQLPMQEMTLILRRLGLQIIEELLAERPEPDLSARLTVRESKLLRHRTPWRINPWRRLVHVPEGFPGNLALGMRDMMSSALLGIISKRQWHYRIRDRIALAVDGVEDKMLPYWAWPLVAQTAWADPAFRHEVAWRIHRRQRDRLPLSDGSICPVMLQPETFWVLLALCDIRPGKHWLRSSERLRARQADRMRHIARVQTLGGQWAGFWDQWIIRMACQQWPQAYQRQPGGFRQALGRMPLMRGVVPQKRRFELANLGKTLWWNLFLPGSRQWRQGKNRKPLKDLELANPGWSGQIPPWMNARFASYR